MHATKRDIAEKKIREWLRTGRCAPGAKLPSILEMARQLKMSDQSVRKAVARLAEAGLLRPVNGVGIFVCESGAPQGKKIMLVAGRVPAPPSKAVSPEAFLDWEIYGGLTQALKAAEIRTVWNILDQLEEEPSDIVRRFEEEIVPV